MSSSHDAVILDQFTKQAAPFARHHDNDAELIAGILSFADLAPDSRLLDVACGPGILACAFAPVVAHVTGIDLVEAMLDQARSRQARLDLHNLAWKQGHATQLPFPDQTFDGVITRFSFHHFSDPQACLREMARVCRTHGKILVIDVSPSPATRAAYDDLEKRRDPSHTSALTEDEFAHMGEAAGLHLMRSARFDLDADLDLLLAASFPPEGNAKWIRAKMKEDMAKNADPCGINPRWKDDRLVFTFPVAAFLWQSNR